ncbi:hypothetical protein NC652_005841 [Populus alba x Populus x berolinensis]|nr:hypothetical protein NC652_005841 [Populus alba x Populus x berolinensis]
MKSWYFLVFFVFFSSVDLLNQ